MWERARKAALRFLHRTGNVVRQEEKLVCKCGDFGHWEIVRGWRHAFILCVACGLKVDGVIEIDRHAQTHWVPIEEPIPK